jgi:tetratricopeptide (TPR) repeat protein
VKGFMKGLFIFTLGMLVGAALVSRLQRRMSERTQRMFVAMDVQRARDLASRGDRAGAREAWIRANLLHPDSFEAHMGLGSFYECTGEWESAVRQYERAIESYPGAARVDLYAPQPDELAEAHARLGRAAQRLGDANLARRSFDEATQIRASTRPPENKGTDLRPKDWVKILDQTGPSCTGARKDNPSAPGK